MSPQLRSPSCGNYKSLCYALTGCIGSGASHTMDGPDEQKGSLCSTCAPIDLNSIDGCTLKLGKLASLAGRQDCPICRFSLKTISKNYLTDYRKISDGDFLDGIQACVTFSIDEGDVRIVRKDKYMHSKYWERYHFEISDARAPNMKSPDLGFIEARLRICHDTHGMLCNPPNHTLATLPKTLRFIDVRTGCIVQAATPELTPYVALSYVWGTQGNVKMTKANKEAFEEPGALFLADNCIPPLIRDAMRLAIGIGQSYLWVDALCIVQDDDADRQLQIQHMHAIYERSYATIITLAAQDVYSRIPGIGSGREFPQYEVVKGKRLWYNTNPGLGALMAESRWTSRAWTFQEHLLSRRRIFVSENEFLVECAEGIASEFGAHGMNLSLDHNLEYMHLPRPIKLGRMQIRGNNTMVNSSKDLAPTLASVQESLVEWDTICEEFPLYAYHVEQYSVRMLTNPEDVLNAFTGLMSAWSRLQNWTFFEGLPLQALRGALCWAPVTTYKSRHHDLHYPSLPTWSWAHVIGRVRFVSLHLDRSEFTSSNPEEAQSSIYIVPGNHRERTGPTTLRIKSPTATFTICSDSALFLAHGQVRGRPQPRLRMMIFDSAKHHCGIVWGLHPSFFDPPGEHEFNFIYLFSKYHDSRADVTTVHPNSYKEAVELASSLMDWRALTLPMDPPLSRSPYDRSVFDAPHGTPPRKTSNWWVMALVVTRRGEYWERIGVGQVCRQAWDEALPRTRATEIV